jgi:hypothetical protein
MFLPPDHGDPYIILASLVLGSACINCDQCDAWACGGPCMNGVRHSKL